MKLNFKSIYFLLIWTILSLGCSPFVSKKPPIVLILLESFSEADYLCSRTEYLGELEHLAQECDELTRLTHVFSPTLLTQPNMASLVTGRRVNEHSVKSNASYAISGEFMTLAEWALDRKMRTALFSGGVPLLPKFGFRQGYETWKQPMASEKGFFFRPISQSFNKFFEWLDDDARNSSFFATIYVPDLLYRNQITVSRSGFERPSQRESVVHEIYESVDELIAELKKRKRWDNSTVIFLGLNGKAPSHSDQNPLRSENTHVTMQVKLAKSLRTNLNNLKSKVVSFDRIGLWLKQLIQHLPSQGPLTFEEGNFGQFIAQSSHWQMELGLSNWPKLGLRGKGSVVAFLPELTGFDTFNDKTEAEPLPPSLLTQLVDKYEMKSQFFAFFQGECYRWPQQDKLNFGCDPFYEKEDLRETLTTLVRWNEKVGRGEGLQNLIEKPMNPMLLGWLARQALQQQKWTELFEIGRSMNNQALMLVAQTNLGEPPKSEPKNCLRYFVGEKKSLNDFYTHCQDSDLRYLVEGVYHLRNKQKANDSFWEQIRWIKSYRQVRELNLEMGLINDIKDPFIFTPTLAELFLYVPDNRVYLPLIDSENS